jgi:hypothetical protein
MRPEPSFPGVAATAAARREADYAFGSCTLRACFSERHENAVDPKSRVFKGSNERWINL